MHLLAFLGIAVLVIVTPGQDTALTIRNTLLRGRRGGVHTAVGVASGQALWALAAGAGMATLLRASQPAFVAIRLAGAAYLIFLGLQSIWLMLGTQDRWESAQGGAGTAVREGCWRQGFVSNLSNPKMAIFFVSLLPQFSGNGSSALPASLLLGSIFCLLTLLWLTGYAWVTDRLSSAFRDVKVRRAIHGLCGAGLIGVGMRIAVEEV